jgi:hypothetical protein
MTHQVGLFIPCSMDAFEPEVGIAIHGAQGGRTFTVAFIPRSQPGRRAAPP